ncbi:MAG TPA: radical SAM protein, partial [Spirochaetes bacterium]|nr:radical SAM protein [Spirochaetota bacterium]
MSLGVYLHIPFCRQKCDYCGFYSIPVGRLDQSERAALLDRYADRLVGEIVQRVDDFRDCAVDTVYFGGGTPSLLAPETVARVMEALSRSMGFAGGPVEVTLECNPEDFSPGRIRQYGDAGINRVVLGLQTLERENREFIGRSSSVISRGLAEEFMAVEGIGHCLDLIIGIPSKKRYLPDEIGMIAALGADHISAYLLSVEEHTPLAGRFVEPEEFQELQREAFMATRAALMARGYHHYEVSNYCLPGKESRHNMKYWKFMP